MSVLAAQQYQIRTGETVTVRSAVAADAAALLKHAAHILGEDRGNVTVAEEFNLTVEQEEAWIRSHRDDPNKLCLVAEGDGRIIGLITLAVRERRRLAHVGVLTMSVHRKWRGKGVASLLMQAVLDWATQHPSIEKVALSVLADNEAALGLYRKMGFVEEGRRVREIKFGPGGYVDDICMYRWVSTAGGLC